MHTQVTLVSLYGTKQSDFAAFVDFCQKTASTELGRAFAAYDLGQIHGTIIGLERQSSTGFDNNNFAKYRQRRAAMDFDGFLNYLRTGGCFPIEIQLGGFHERDYPFTSQLARPFERSFSIQGDKVVVIGWPIRDEPAAVIQPAPAALVRESRVYPLTLDALRHGAQEFGILHAYHRAPTDVDNDLFFRVGLVDHQFAPAGSIPRLERRMRDYMSQAAPLILEVTMNDVFVVAYDDATLPVGRSRACL